jgi:hypothetical protein
MSEPEPPEEIPAEVAGASVKERKPRIRRAGMLIQQGRLWRHGDCPSWPRLRKENLMRTDFIVLGVHDGGTV